MRSLLLRYGLAMTSIVLVAFLVPLGLLDRSLAQDRALTAARQDAGQVAALIGDDPRLVAEVLAVNASPRSTTVFFPDDRVLGADMPRDDGVELAATGRAFTERVTGGIAVLLPVGGTSGTVVVRTFVPDAELTDGVAQAWAVLAAVGLVLLVATAWAGDRVGRRLSRSTQDLAQVADRLGHGDLDARVEPSGPAEIVSVGQVLNGLGDRVRDLLSDERELIADLSHRMRTPITALRLEVDLLDDPSDRERLAHQVDRLVTAVDEVISTARNHGRRGPQQCDATQIVQERARYWEVLAAPQGRSVALLVPHGPTVVSLSPGDLGASIDVLVENVFRHTPAGTSVGLEVRADASTVTVAVADTGPGLPPGDPTERGSSSAGSTGLGLDVVRRTAEQGGGELRLTAGPRGRGVRASMVLPRVFTKA
jgi:signal transduction histidine kinase